MHNEDSLTRMTTPDILTPKEYEPPQEIIDRYAEVILSSVRRNVDGTVIEGVKSGDRVIVSFPEEANALGAALIKEVHELGAIFVPRQDSMPLELELANVLTAEQREIFARAMIYALANTSDHFIDVAAIRGYEGIDQEFVNTADKIGSAMRSTFVKATTDADKQLESRVKIYWPTADLAKQNKTTVEEIWKNLIAGLCLDDENPLERLAESDAAVKENTEKLNNLDISEILITSNSGDTSLIFSLAQDSCWVGASGANRPSYESFTTPKRDSANGYITYDVPVKTGDKTFTKLKIYYENGRAFKIEGPDGTESHTENQMFSELINDNPNFDRLGEFALTPKALSKLNQGFGVVLWTENLPGLHFAHGSSYSKNYAGDKPKNMTEAEWEELGYNQSGRHFDLVRMGDFTVTATLKDGTQMQVFADGNFSF